MRYVKFKFVQYPNMVVHQFSPKLN